LKIAEYRAKGILTAMKLVELITPDSVCACVSAGSKKQVLEELSRKAAVLTGIDYHTIFDVLVEREKLGSTGIGGGVAIPHGTLSSLDRIHGCFAQLHNPVIFDTIDERPVDLLFVILAPENAAADHLKVLAQISRLMRDKSLCDKLRQSDRPETLYALLTDTTTHSAA
jgi:PTS system nitrogen regulatory IIA component